MGRSPQGKNIKRFGVSILAFLKRFLEAKILLVEINLRIHREVIVNSSKSKDDYFLFLLFIIKCFILEPMRELD